MDIKKDSSVSDVPTFKVARVGNDRKRKGGAFSFLRGGGTRGVWTGATGGSGAGAGSAGLNVLGMTFSKALVAIMVSASVGSAAVYLGARSAANVGSRGGGDAKPAIFSDRGAVQIEGDTSNLPATATTIPNSLGYVAGSRDGLTPEERAKKAAEAAEAAAAAEAQAVADAEAAKKAEEDAAKAGPNPADLLAAAQADGGKEGKDKGFAKKFGSLSSSFGGGGSALSGGAGLSGGVNRQFGAGGNIMKGTGGQLGAMKGQSRPTYAKSGRKAADRSKTKGFARKQLANANALSRRGASASQGETSAYDAASAFDNNDGAGNVISGPGIGDGTGQSTGGGSTPNTTNTGGPTGGGQQQVDCGANNYQTADGSCAPLKVSSGKDANPTLTMLAQIAQALLLAIAVITLVAWALEKFAYTYAMGTALRAVIGIMGGIVALMGVAIMAMGDYMQGAIFAGIGGFIAIACWGVGDQALTAPGAVVSAGAGLLMSQAAGALKGGSGQDKAPVAAQQ